MSEMPPPQPEPSVQPRPIPWEDPGEPAVSGLFRTIGLFIAGPDAAFTRMPTTGGFGRPILYMVLVGWPVAVVSGLIGLAFQGAILALIPEGMDRGAFFLPPVVTAILLALYPVVLLVVLFIKGGILHLMLLLLGGAGQGFEATLRTVCYAWTSQLAQIIPICGGLIALIWDLVLLVIGLARAQRVSHGKAALAVLLPLLLCCACAGAVIAIAFGAGLMEGLSH